MSTLSRRSFAFAGLSGLAVTAACGNGIASRGPETIDARVHATLNHLYDNYPNTRDLADKAAGLLVMPVVTEAGFGLGGGYGRGALQVDEVIVDYYSTTKANIGLQIGAQQYAHVLFFMTQDALIDFRRSNGWAAGGDIEYVIADEGGSVAAETTTALAPVIAVVFGQAGLRLGATIEGSKYTRIIP
jgi:lipid-binding SYLF domain-containing protein